MTLCLARPIAEDAGAAEHVEAAEASVCVDCRFSGVRLSATTRIRISNFEASFEPRSPRHRSVAPTAPESGSVTSPRVPGRYA